MKNKYRCFFAVLLSCILLLPSVPAHASEPEPIRIAFLDSGISLKHLDPSRVETGENLVFPRRDAVDRIGHGTATAGIVLGSEDEGISRDVLRLCDRLVSIPEFGNIKSLNVSVAAGVLIYEVVRQRSSIS